MSTCVSLCHVFEGWVGEEVIGDIRFILCSYSLL